MKGSVGTNPTGGQTETGGGENKPQKTPGRVSTKETKMDLFSVCAVVASSVTFILLCVSEFCIHTHCRRHKHKRKLGASFTNILYVHLEYFLTLI